MQARPFQVSMLTCNVRYANYSLMNGGIVSESVCFVKEYNSYFNDIEA